MGSFFSSTSRRTLSKTVTSASNVAKPMGEAVRTPGGIGESSSQREVPHPVARRPLASAEKDQDILQDSKDPQLVANLYRLGQVQSGKDRQAQTSSVAEMHRKLQDSEVMASSIRTPRNHLRPSALVELFDERKALASRFELERLAGRYNMDINVMERLARYVNTPSISEAGTHTTVSGDNEQVKKMLALWESPRFANEETKGLASARDS